MSDAIMSFIISADSFPFTDQRIYLHAALAFFRFRRSCRFFQAHRHVLSLFYLTISTPDPCSYDDTGSRIFLPRASISHSRQNMRTRFVSAQIFKTVPNQLLYRLRMIPWPPVRSSQPAADLSLIFWYQHIACRAHCKACTAYRLSGTF